MTYQRHKVCSTFPCRSMTQDSTSRTSISGSTITDPGPFDLPLGTLLDCCSVIKAMMLQTPRVRWRTCEFPLLLKLTKGWWSSLATQMTENFTSPWYGDFKLSPDGKRVVPSPSLASAIDNVQSQTLRSHSIPQAFMYVCSKSKKNEDEIRDNRKKYDLIRCRAPMIRIGESSSAPS